MHNKVPPICDHQSMNGHTWSGIYDLAQTPSSEIKSYGRITVSVAQCKLLCNLHCNGVTRQVAGRLQRVTCPLYNLSHNYFWLAMIALSELVLHDVIFLSTCLATSEKNPLQVAEDMLHVATSSCSLLWFQEIHAVVAERAKLYFVQSLEAQKSFETSCKEGMLKACNLPATCIATLLQHKLQRNFHHATIVVELGSTLCNDCRDFLQSTCNLYRHTIATQVPKKLAPCNNSSRAWFYFLE